MARDGLYRDGALPGEDGVRFHVWAPYADRLELVLEHKRLPMEPVGNGHFEMVTEEAEVGSRYGYSKDGEQVWPDPASRFQPDGVHGPSQVIDPYSYRWRTNGWAGLELKKHIYYELHVGTYTPEGTFREVIDKLSYLKDLGITVVELMPVADFPGGRNWGYDPAALFSPSRAYGEPDDLRRLVDEAHALGLAVFLDVIYNHFGPDGAYAVAFSPLFFTDRHHTPWGKAINLDGEGAKSVRAFFIENALHWLHEYRFDGLRLDATFTLIDDSERHFLAELAEALSRLEGPKRHLIAPQLPLLFMGQEWAATSPFLFFTDHHDELGRLVSKGRKEEFSDFPEFLGEVPDPQALDTFLKSKLKWEEAERMPHKGMLEYYRFLLALRKRLSGEYSAESPSEGGLVMRRGRHSLLVALKDSVALDLPPGAEIVWHGEQEVYTDSPLTPRIAEGQVFFERPAAVLAEFPEV